MPHFILHPANRKDNAMVCVHSFVPSFLSVQDDLKNYAQTLMKFSGLADIGTWRAD